MDRYARQRGLVVQDLVGDAEISVHGTGPALTYLLQCLTLLGVGSRHGRIRLCPGARKVRSEDVGHQFLLREEDIGTPIADALAYRLAQVDPAVVIDEGLDPVRGPAIAVPSPDEVDTIRAHSRIDVWAQVLPTSVHIGPEPARGSAEPNALTAALGAVSGGLAAQAVLNHIGAIVCGPTVLSSWVEERLWLAWPGIGRRAKASRASAPALRGLLTGEPESRFEILSDGVPADARIAEIVDDDTVVVTVPGRSGRVDLPTRTVARAVRQAPVPLRTVRWSPFSPSSDGVEPPAGLPASRLVMCGAGALGSWVAGVLAATPSRGLDLCVVDMDDAVETHNLNRQVLYGPGDVGQPKAVRAVERLAEINPAVRAYAIQTVIAPEHRDDLLGDAVHYDVLDADIVAQRQRLNGLRDALRTADAILSCPDNQQTRWVLNVVAERLGVPLVNGAIDGFVGRIHVCDPADHGRCLVCWLGTSIAGDPTRRSCTDLLGPAPVPSIVTSAAIVGGVQAATLVAGLIGHAGAVGRFHVLDGSTGELAGYRAADRDPSECPSHLLAAR